MRILALAGFECEAQRTLALVRFKVRICLGLGKGRGIAIQDALEAQGDPRQRAEQRANEKPLQGTGILRNRA